MAAALTEQQNGFDSNARYDIGPNAAGCGRCSTQSTMVAYGPSRIGLQDDGHVGFTTLRVGQNVAGAPRSGQNGVLAIERTNNGGGSVAGAPRSETDDTFAASLIVPLPPV